MTASDIPAPQGEPTTRDEIEAALRAKYESGDLYPGLFSTDVAWVAMIEVAGKLEFRWFGSATSIDSALHAD